ncbi:LysR family transcriptional regulator [Longispora urticae]
MGSRLGLADLVPLGLFVDAVATGSISAAARAHQITQPSASEALRRLERRVGVELLIRTPRGCRPTAEGARLADLARDLLAAADRFAGEAETLRAGAQGRIRVAASYTNAEYVLPGRIAAAGDVTVSLTVANSDEVTALVRSGAVDVGFVEGPIPTAGLTTRLFDRDELVVLVAPEHAWARLDGPLPLETLVATRLLLREAESGTRRTYEAAAAAAGHLIAEPFGVMTSTEALKAAVRAGLGATILSRLAVREELAAGSLVLVPVDGFSLARELRAIRLAGSRDKAVTAFVQAVSRKNYI